MNKQDKRTLFIEREKSPRRQAAPATDPGALGRRRLVVPELLTGIQANKTRLRRPQAIAGGPSSTQG